MGNRINVAELLKDCPQGMEMDCTSYNGVVSLKEIIDNSTYPIKINVVYGNECLVYSLTKYGQTWATEFHKCVIFPKGKTTWEGFHRPFKDGDIIYTKHKLGTEFVSIFQIEYERDICTYWDINLSTNKLIGNLHDGNAFKVFIEKDKVKEQRLAAEEEKQKLFDAIKANGYKWNAETKTLGKLPRFKVGDIVKSKNCPTAGSFVIVGVGEDSYSINIKGYCIKFDDQDNYELVPNKFDINTLKPFDAVLVRNTNNDRWRGQFYMSYDKNEEYPFECTYNCWKQCIPYENNEHLFKKIDDCDNYYRNWEEL